MTDGKQYGETHCRRCGDEMADDWDKGICESCTRHIELEKRLNGVDCENCDGYGKVYGTFCDLQRAMNGRDTRCPECGGSGRVAYEPDDEALVTDGGQCVSDTEIFVDRPKLSSFDLSSVREPSDGILYLYRSSVDRQWYVESDEDMALQEATGYPVGEIVEYEEQFDDHETGEEGFLIAIYVGEPEDDTDRSDDLVYGGVCPVCGDEFTDGFERLQDLENESIEGVRLCVIDPPEETLIHLPEDQTDHSLDTGTDHGGGQR